MLCHYRSSLQQHLCCIMTLGIALATCFKKYADFHGRASRSEYWFFALFVIVVLLVLQIVAHWRDDSLLARLVGLALVTPVLAVGTRRLHDTNRSGWMQILVLLPLLGWLAMLIFLTQDPAEPNHYGTAVPRAPVLPQP